MSDLATFGAEDDWTHSPTDGDPSFQESALFVWYDAEAGVGGFWRLGQEPVAAALSSCFGMFAADGRRFRSNVTGVAMLPGDRGETHMGWGPELRVDLDRLAITADFPDCEATLVFEDFFPRYDWMQLIGMAGASDHMKAHFEVAGRMTGKVRIGDREIAVNALGYRDRSWGPRKWGNLRATRWWPCVFGPDLCVHTMAMVDEDGLHAALGYVIEDGKPMRLLDVDVLATMSSDAVSPRSAEATFTWREGVPGKLTHMPADGVVLHVRGFSAIESIGTVRWGDRVGMSNFEVSTNPAGGSQPPAIAFGASNGEGLSWR